MRRWLAMVVMGCGSPPPPPVTAPRPVDPPVIAPRPVDPQIVCGRGPTIKGIDVSTYQGQIDWPAVKADGVEFAFVRVSHGTVADPSFKRNRDGAAANQILHGAYQYFHPGEDVIAQADMMLATIDAADPNELLPVIDVEDNGGLAPAEVAARVQLWIDHVTPTLHTWPIIYTGFYFWRDRVGASNLTTAPLWSAQYTSEACPRIPPPWTAWAFWQFTSKGTIAGITGPVDVDRFNGTHDDLMKLTLGAHASDP